MDFVRPGVRAKRERPNNWTSSWRRHSPSTRRKETGPTARVRRACHPIFISAKSVCGESGTRLVDNGEAAATRECAEAIRVYSSELGWREFAHHLLFHFPHTPEKPLRKEFAAFPWEADQKNLSAWQRGRTGYPIVDAGMRELWHTGWMHNRVRMIVASFLVKDLLIPWQHGAAWFWDTLVDADLANNTLGWQWTAGCGADAAPYFRVFNPVSQGEKFDPSGEYVRRWVPELNRLPNAWIHKPWEAPPGCLPARKLNWAVPIRSPSLTIQRLVPARWKLSSESRSNAAS